MSTLNEKVEYVKGLRALADFVEANSELDVFSYHTASVFVSTKEQFADAARRLGTADKEFSDYYATLVKKFSDTVSLQVSTNRENVCERIVVGKKTVPATAAIPAQPEREVDIVEWRCGDSLLASTGESVHDTGAAVAASVEVSNDDIPF